MLSPSSSKNHKRYWLRTRAGHARLIHAFPKSSKPVDQVFVKVTRNWEGHVDGDGYGRVPTTSGAEPGEFFCVDFARFALFVVFVSFLMHLFLGFCSK